MVLCHAARRQVLAVNVAHPVNATLGLLHVSSDVHCSVEDRSGDSGFVRCPGQRYVTAPDGGIAPKNRLGDTVGTVPYMGTVGRCRTVLSFMEAANNQSLHQKGDLYTRPSIDSSLPCKI